MHDGGDISVVWKVEGVRSVRGASDQKREGCKPLKSWKPYISLKIE